MPNSTAQASQFGDKERMKDLLAGQKQIAETYSVFANECATPGVRTDFMSLLNEEHQIQNEVFSEMQKRGWYPTEAAEQQKIDQVKRSYGAS